MRLLVDENCAQAELLSRLSAAGHDVETVAAAMGSGARDEDIVSYAIAQRRAIVTKDVADFTELLSDREDHAGLLLIREGAYEPRMTAANLARAIDNLSTTYSSLDGYVLSLNAYVW